MQNRISAHPQMLVGINAGPIQKSGFFLLGKAAQGFAARRTQRTSQLETRGERRPTEKRPFMNEHYLVFLEKIGLKI